jgi:hypothetical protein
MIPHYEQLKGGMLGYLRGLQPTQPAMTNMTQATTYWHKGRWDGFWEQGLFLVNLSRMVRESMS